MESQSIGGLSEFFFTKCSLELTPSLMMIQCLSIRRSSRERSSSQDPSTRKLVALTFRNAKSLVKHILQADLSKRYGNLKNGVNDIKGHRFFNGMNWTKLLARELKPTYIPNVK
jgi:hypothetical protein